MATATRSALAPFLILFAALYAGFGVQSPYLPALLDDRGLRPEAIGMVLAAGTAVRLAAGPAAGRLADRLDAAKLVFAGCAAAAALMALLYLSAQGFWPLFAVGLLQAAALAPLAPLCDPGKSWGVTASPRSSGSMRRCLPPPHYVPHGYGSSRLGLWRHPRRPAASAAASLSCSGCGSSVAWCWSRR